MTAEQILRAAADHIRKYGWTQHEYGRPGHPCCVLGAMRAVAPGLSRAEALDVFEDTVDESYVDFNDLHCQTADDAIAALEIAADLAAPEWNP